VVNSLADTVVSRDGVCTLREAILNAERDNHAGSTDCAAGSGADTITFSLSGTISLKAEELGSLDIASAGGLTIDGGGKITVTCSNYCDPLLSVGSAGVLTLDNLTLGGDLTFGSAITNNGIMTISHCTVSGFYGSGIFNNTTMTISDSTISNNRNPTEGRPPGSGIHNIGTLTISTSTVSGNQHDVYWHGDSSGGAIYNGREGTLTISTSTFSGNMMRFGNYEGLFSGIYNEGALTIHSSTVSDNVGPQGLGISNSGTLKLHSSLISDGCSGPITSLGYNLDKTSSCGLAGPGDKSNIDPQLDPAGLKDNGGPTKTIALCTGAGSPTGCTGKSPVIDAVPLAHCTGAGGEPLGLDQREYFRPADGDHNGTAFCDMGAFEAGSKPLQTANSLVTFTPLPATYQTSRDTTGCPAGYVGKFHFTADLTTKPGSPPLSHLVAEVASLTKGNVVLNADGGLGGDGATVTIGSNGQYADGLLMTKEHVALPVTLCLKTFNQFTFFVDVLGTH
jgi:CSLREA domain-containing protein